MELANSSHQLKIGGFPWPLIYEGCFIVRKEDGFIMGEAICLGDEDTIDNYKDKKYTKKSYEEFYTSIGMEIPKKEEQNKK